MRYNFLLIFLTVLTTSHSTRAQVGIGTNSPSPHAMLDVNSSYKGVILPRLNAAQQAALNATLTSGQAGMLVLDSASGKIVYWTGSSASSWKDLDKDTIAGNSPFTVSSINNIALNPGTAAGDLITWDGANWVNMQPAVQHFTVTQDNRQPILTLNYCIALQGIFPSRNGETPFLSEIQLFSFNYAPKGYAQCNGQILSLQQNVALFALVGTTYGGNGQTTFGLPDLQGRVPIHFGQGPGLSNYNLGDKGGIEQNTITR